MVAETSRFRIVPAGLRAAGRSGRLAGGKPMRPEASSNTPEGTAFGYFSFAQSIWAITSETRRPRWSVAVA